jgi:HK97 family phage major capsid protein
VKSLEFKRKRTALEAEQKELAKKAELSADEKTRWDALETELTELGKEITREESRENILRQEADEKGNHVSRSEEKDIQKYSIVKAIREQLQGGRLTGLEAEMQVEAVREMSQISGIGGLGISSKILHNLHRFQLPENYKKRTVLGAASSPVVPTNIGNFLDAIWAKTVLVGLGVQTMSGLTGNVELPYISTKPTVKWDAENDAADDAGMALNKVSLTPKRATNYVPLSKLLLIQESADIERKVWDALIQACAVTFQRAAIHGGSDAPTGLLGTVGIGNVAGGTDGAPPTLLHVLQLIKEVAIDDADFGSLAFLTSPKIRYKLMTTAIESGHPERVWNILQPNMLVGYNAAVSTLVSDTLTKGSGSGVSVCSAIIFGNWAKMILAQFGALDLTVDPYTSAKSNQVDLILNAFYDVGIENPVCFSAMKDALSGI